MVKLELILCMASLALTLFLAALDIIIVVTLYDTIGRKFNDYADIGWLVTGYSLSSALFTLLWGRLSSLFGLKSNLVASIIIFEIGSLIVALSDSMGMLIGGRVIAGIGGSGIQSLVFVVATSLVEARNRGVVTSVMSLAFMVSNAIGPVIGGAFTEHSTWRWCFYINLPIGGFALFMLALNYNPTGKPVWHQLRSHLHTVLNFNYRWLATAEFWATAFNFFFYKLDFVGFALSSSGFVLLLLGITFGGNRHPWNSGSTIAYLVVGGGLILLFFVYDFIVFPRLASRLHNTQTAMPLLPWHTVKILGVFTSSMANFFCTFAFNMHAVYLVQFFQIVFNQGATAASMHMWGLLVPTLVTIIVMARINSKIGVLKPMIVFGAICGVVGSGLMTMFKGSTTTGQSIGYSILPGIAFGAIMQATMLSAQVQIEKDDPEYRIKFIEVTTLNAFVKALGLSFGGIVGTMVFETTVKNELKNSTLSLPDFASIESLIAYRATHYDGSSSPLARILTRGVRNTFLAALGCYCCSFIFSIFTSNRRLEFDTKKPDPEKPALDEDAVNLGSKEDEEEAHYATASVSSNSIEKEAREIIDKEDTAAR
ncbi:LAFE_0E01838g1_1 [Lachancea fermentati]|uniref:LAFE_0E01838g1_1 n=1 Tax=Lachancea fermentati TaxID=4955 RepID=A0A1G4MCE8_LACFM|nr:LAFE_0E01838g1_1 [Lachancea fermentati]